MNTIQRSVAEEVRNQEEAQDILRRAQELVEAHTHFTGRARNFEFTLQDDTLIVRGCVPSFYLKQVLQNALKGLEGVRCIDNQVTVLAGRGTKHLDYGLS